MSVSSPNDLRSSKLRLNFSRRLLLRRAGERESLLLILICFIDMATTLWWVTTGRAIEANPLLAPTFDVHPAFFVLVKYGSFLPAIWFAPRLARRHPRFTVWLLRFVIAAYVSVYALAVR